MSLSVMEAKHKVPPEYDSGAYWLVAGKWPRDIKDFDEVVQLDMQYIVLGILKDIKSILLLTVGIVITGKGFQMTKKTVTMKIYIKGET